MNFTFGIITDYKAKDRVSEIITSIVDLNITNYEVLVITSNNVNPEPIKNCTHVSIEDPYEKGWVTRKKNIVSNLATYDNLVLLHDYYVFDKDWYKHYLKFGDDWDVCSNPQYLINGNRHFTDWVTWDSPLYPRWTSLDYDDWSHTKFMYQSGGYMLVKKQFMLKVPMNESLGWGTAEDVEWSLRMRNSAVWKCNKNSIVRHNKRHRDAA